MNREETQNRRPGFIRLLIFWGVAWDVHFCFTWPRGRVNEILLSIRNGSGSELDACARDGAAILSNCLQRGASLEELAAAVARDHAGKPASIFGAALDLVLSEQKKLIDHFGLGEQS